MSNTEANLAQAALRELADTALHLVWMSDADGACTYLNPGAPALLHRIRLLRMSDWAVLVHPDDRERLRPLFRRSRDRREEFHVDYRLLQSDGTVRWVLSSGAPRYTSKGEFAGFVGAIREAGRQQELLAELMRRDVTHRLLIENSSDLITHHAADSGDYLYVSPSSERILGRLPADMLGTSCYNDFHPDDRPVVRAEIARQVGGGRDERQIEFRVRHRDGHYVWMGAKVRVLFDPQTGTKIGSVVVSREMTAERRAREELQRSEERFRSLLSLSSDWYWETDADDRFTFMSEELHRLFGVDAADMIGKTRIECAADPEEPLLRTYQERLAARAPFRELRYSKHVESGGRVRHAALSGEPVFENGVFAGYRGVGRDVTEQIEVAQRLARLGEENAALIENSLDIIALVDAGGRLLRVNRAAFDVLGYTPEEMTGRPYADFLVPEERAPLAAIDAGLRSGPATIQNLESRWLRKDGTTARLELSVRWSQETKLLYATARDVTETHRTREALRKSTDSMSAMLESIGDAFFALDRDWRVTYVNRKTAEFVGRRRDDLVGRIVWDAVPEILDSSSMAHYRHAMTTGRQASFETFWAPTGAWCEVRVYPNDDGLSIYFHDVSARRQAENAIRASEEKFRRIIEMTPAGYAYADGSGVLSDVNPALCRMTGYTRAELLGHDIRLRIAAGRWGAALLRSGGPVAVQGRESVIRHKDGHSVYVLVNANVERDADGNALALTALVTDISERKRAEARLETLATHDALTGLPNRALLTARLQQLFQRATPPEPVAVLFIDLDRFKEVNDSLGHAPGDQLLNEVARRLNALLGPEDMVARLGGDEFVIVMPCAPGAALAAGIVERLLAALAEPMEIAGQEVVVRASVGISLYPQDGDTIDGVLQNADIAMYCAKADGRNGYRFFEAAMSVAARNRLAIEQSLHRALERQQFELYYQPRLDLSTMDVIGMEALIRWNHPQLGHLRPLDFIPLAEERGFIGPIGRWVIEEACRRTRCLMDTLGRPLRVSVNLSARQLKDPGLIDCVRGALDDAGLPAAALELELTETAMVEDMEQSVRMFRNLKALGVSLAVDDFGTGYSGLAYLGHFPLDVLKMDRSMIGQQASGSGARVVQAFVDMAHALEFSVVAEGVETEDTLAFLRRIGCDEAQGYLFAAPLAYEQLLVFLQGWKGQAGGCALSAERR